MGIRNILGIGGGRVERAPLVRSGNDLTAARRIGGRIGYVRQAINAAGGVAAGAFALYAVGCIPVTNEMLPPSPDDGDVPEEVSPSPSPSPSPTSKPDTTETPGATTSPDASPTNLPTGTPGTGTPGTTPTSSPTGTTDPTIPDTDTPVAPTTPDTNSTSSPTGTPGGGTTTPVEPTGTATNMPDDTSPTPIVPVDRDNDGFPVDTDCDDTNPNVNPGAKEVCDELDNNCDKQIDEGVTVTFYLDFDQDGYGLANLTVQACFLPSGYAYSFEDCDDANSAINPGATELCNGVDDDCDDQIDEDLKGDKYLDADLDNYGVGSLISVCLDKTGYSWVLGDCDDGNAVINPGATEICDGVDNNCDAQIDEGVQIKFYVDADLDGYGVSTSSILACYAPSSYAAVAGDCDDNNDTILPGTSTCPIDAVSYANCGELFDAGMTDSAYYTVNYSQGVGYQPVYCRDGYTRFFVDKNGQPNAIELGGSFENFQIECPDLESSCLMRLPDYADTSCTVAATLNELQDTEMFVTFDLNDTIISLLRDGITGNGFVSIDNVTDVYGNVPAPCKPDSFWVGMNPTLPSWIIAYTDNDTKVNPNTSYISHWDYNDGWDRSANACGTDSSDITSQIGLYFDCFK